MKRENKKNNKIHDFLINYILYLYFNVRQGGQQRRTARLDVFKLAS